MVLCGGDDKDGAAAAAGDIRYYNGLDCVLAKTYVQALTLVLVNVTLSGNRVFADVIEFRRSHEDGP